MVPILVSCESPLYVHPHSKIILNQSINDDAEFLTSQLVMDYSLLVGLDEDSGELVLGIIGEFSILLIMVKAIFNKHGIQCISIIKFYTLPKICWF